MAIDKHPMTQVPRHIDVLLTRHHGRRVFTLFHKNSYKLVANFRDHFGIVYGDKLVILYHILVKNKAFLDVLLVRLKTAFSHLSFC